MIFILISEKLFLVSIKEKSSKIVLDWFDYLLYGAIMMDLVFTKKISISKDTFKIEIITQDSDDDIVLEEMIALIKSSKGGKTFLEVCFSFLKKSNRSHITELLVSKLETLGIIKYLGKKMLKKRYQVVNSEKKNEILNEIQSVLIDNQKPTTELLYLLSILKVELSILKIIPKKLKKMAQKRIMQVVKNEFLGEKLQDYIDDLKEEAQEALDDIFDDD